MPKMRVVGAAKIVDEEQAQRLFSVLPDPDKTLILLSNDGDPQPPANPNVVGTADVPFFSANRVVVKVRTDAPAWLYYADAFHPAWHATLNGRPARIYRANLGFKAVAVDSGLSEVVFTFDDGRRNWVRLGLYGVSLIVGCVLLGAMLLSAVSPWRRRPPGELTGDDEAGLVRGEEVAGQSCQVKTVLAVPELPPDYRRIRIFCAWAVVANLGGVLWIGWGMNAITLGILLAASLVVFGKVFRNTGTTDDVASMRTDGKVALLSLSVLLFWVWQTGLTLEVNLCLLAMFLGYLATNRGFRERFNLRKRPGAAAVFLMLSLLGFLASIAWLSHVDRLANAQAQRLFESLKRHLERAQVPRTQAFIRQTFARIQVRRWKRPSTRSSKMGFGEKKSRIAMPAPVHLTNMSCS